jgi:hypothetical protein
VFALACIVFGVGMAARVCIDELHRQAANDSLARRLAAEGRETEAKVSRLWTALGRCGVTYDYTVDGRSYDKNAFIASEHWQPLQVGSSLAIRYLPSDPSKAYPDSDPPNFRNNWSLVLPTACFFLGIFSVFSVLQFSPVWTQRRLLAGGRPARGVVICCKESQGRRRGYVLRYEFPLAEGGQCQGKGFSEPQVAEGSIVTVLYDPSKPLRNALYPMETVRLAAI